MKISKNRFTKIIYTSALTIIIVIILWFLRTTIFNVFFSYQYGSERPSYGNFNNNSEIIVKIKKDFSEVTQIDIKQIINYSLDLTAEYLSFHSENTSNEPDVLITLKRANCVGYASFLNAVLNEVSSVNTKVKLQSYHVVGNIKFLGININRYLSSYKFLKDHDFNIVVDLDSGKKYFIDASLYDFCGIGIIRSED